MIELKFGKNESAFCAVETDTCIYDIICAKIVYE